MGIAASLGISTMAMAHGGGGGGHFGGGHFGGGNFGHFGGGHFGGGHRHVFFNGSWPYDGGWGYGGLDDSMADYSDSDSTVATVQKALARAGYYHGTVDGALDLTTQDAIARFDRDHHLPVSRAIDQSLLNALGVE